MSEDDLGSLSLALTAILPGGMSYLTSTDLSTADFRQLLNCDGCDNLSDETAQWMLGADEGMNWYKHVVDTRPWNDLVVVFTDHSMHHRDDALLLLRETAKGKLAVVPSEFGQPDEMCCDRPFNLLRVGDQLKIVRLPSYEFFRESEASTEGNDEPGGQGNDLVLDVYDDPTKPEQTGGRCSVHYGLRSRLVVDSNFSDASRTEQLLDREVGDMVTEFALAEQKGAVRFPNNNRFVDRKTPASEIANVRAFLTSQDFADNLTYDAMKVLAVSGAKPYYGDDRGVESRWFALSNGPSAYAALLMRNEGVIEDPFLALFKVDGGTPRLYASVQLKNAYVFSGASAESGE